jgi:hypothetical protein
MNQRFSACGPLVAGYGLFLQPLSNRAEKYRQKNHVPLKATT